MAKKDAGSRKEDGAFSDSAEIFDDIFKEATLSIEKLKQATHPSTAGGRTAPQKKNLQAGKPVRPIPTTPRPGEKGTPVRPQSIIKSETEYKSRKPISIPKISILLVLLLILGGALLSYFGIVEISPVLDLFGQGKKEIVQAPPPKRAPSKTPGKAGSAPTKKQVGEKVASGALPPSAVPKKAETPAPAEPKQEPAKVEAPSPILQAHEGVARQEPPSSVQPAQAKAEEPASTAATQTAAQVPAPVSPPAPVVAPVQHQQVPARVQPVTPPQPPPQAPMESKQKLATQGVRPPAVQTQPSPGPAAPEAGLHQTGSLQYPYSIYLGSYQTLERAEKAISSYQQEGLAVYWSRVNLGQKGIWYRVFAGYFRSEAEASDFIAKRRLKEAEVKRTTYSALIGVYASREEAQQKSAALLNLGFPTYVIPEAHAKFRLYSGAFVSKDGAEVNVADLASRGIQSRAVER
jgi:hypothetical protein